VVVAAVSMAASALDRLQVATDAYLESLKGPANDADRTVNERNYVTVLTALRTYIQRVGRQWTAGEFSYPDKCNPQAR
jgi:hypothetical protein